MMLYKSLPRWICMACRHEWFGFHGNPPLRCPSCHDRDVCPVVDEPV